MFKHIYLNSLKIFLREKIMVFWLLLFPMILAIFFKLAFSNLTDGENFEKIPVAVDNTNDDVNMYKSIFDSLGDTLSVQYTDEETALRLLSAGEIDAYITAEAASGADGEGTSFRLAMKVQESGLNQSIVHSILNKINEGTELVMSGAVAPEDIGSVMSVENVLENVSISGQKQDYVSAWFYTILGMAAMYGSMLGVMIIEYTQANQSAKAMRFNMAPVSKMGGFGAMFAAAATLHSAIMVMIYLYLKFIMNIDFGDRQGYIVLTSVIGGITGISIGSAISVLVKAGNNFKTGVCVAVSMLCSYLSGMMDNSVKYTVMKKAPVIEYINPAGILTDSYLKLYYYEKLDYFWGNVINLLVIIAVCMAVTILVLRRQRYDSV